MRSRSFPGGIFAFVVLAAIAQPVLRAQWPQFRGPDGIGLAPARAGTKIVPLTWAEDRNVRWKTPIHGRAWSSPVVLGDQIWTTTATEDGRQLFAIAVDRMSGRIVHDLKLFEVAQPQYAHPFNTYASPTPVIEPGRVYATFGAPGTAAIDTKSGKVIWERRDFECNHFRGAGSSPILFENLLIMHFDGSDHQFLVALDKRTGKTIWRTERSVDFQDLAPSGKPKADGDFRKGFATPHVINVGGRQVLISMGSKATYGYDVRTGEELWKVVERGSHSPSTRPVPGFGMVFVPTGFDGSQLLAIRPDGKGDVTGTHVAWRVTRGVPQKPSILLVNELIFMINDGGIVSAVDPKTGEVVGRGRIEGTYSASPIAAGDRIYAFSEDGKTTVLEASRELKVLGESHLADGFMASPAIDGSALILRTKTHLYRIEETGAK
jgi:outer membrane protein assembly factor BamB